MPFDAEKLARVIAAACAEAREEGFEQGKHSSIIYANTGGDERPFTRPGSYQAGFKAGRAELQKTLTINTRSHMIGFDAGHAVGIVTGREQGARDASNTHAEFDRGYQEGQKFGYWKGRQEADRKQYQKGYEMARRSRTLAFEEGKRVGLAECAQKPNLNTEPLWMVEYWNLDQETTIPLTNKHGVITLFKTEEEAEVGVARRRASTNIVLPDIFEVNIVQAEDGK